MKKKKWRFKDSIQRHHLIYETASPERSRRGVTIIQPEVIAYAFGKEHLYISRLNYFKYVSKGFIKALKLFVLIHEDGAVKLTRKMWKAERLKKGNIITAKQIEKLKRRL